MLKRSLFLFLIALMALAAFPAFAQEDATACETGVNYIRRAESALMEDRFTHAIDAYTCAIEADSEDYEAYMGRAVAGLLNAALAADFSHSIVADLQVVYENDPMLINTEIARMSAEIAENEDDYGAYAVRGYLYWYTLSDDQAMDDYDRLIQIDSGNPFGYIYRGGANYAHNNTAKAASDFARALRVAPENADVHWQIAAIYLADEPELSIDYLNTAIELNPERASYFADRGYAHSALGDYEAALDDYAAALELEPENVFHYANRAYTYEQLEDYEAALADYDAALEIDPEYQYAYYARGWAQISQENYEAALADFERALRLDPTDKWSILGRATANSELGNIEDAAVDFESYVAATQFSREVHQPVRFDSPVSLSLYEGLVVAVPFSANAKDVVTITATSPDGAVDPLILLLGPDGNPLVGNDDASPTELNSIINGYELPEAGRYTLLVTHAGGGSLGELDVTIVGGKQA